MSTQVLAIDSPVVTPVEGTASKVVRGTTALGMSMVLERGAGFLGNVLAARLAGASVFGAYSLAIGTANSISTYAAAGIGATAARFSGKYPFGSVGFHSLARALMLVALASSFLGGFGLYLGAPFVARLLHKPSMAHLFHWAAWSVAGIILLECARGFLVGQRRVQALLLLSLLVGLGMIAGMTATSMTGDPVKMVMAQSAVAMVAVLVCVLFVWRTDWNTHPRAASQRTVPVLREVAAFGAAQMYGLVGTNVAGWWLMAVVARSDTTLKQVSFLAIASQLRNIAGMIPGLLTEGSYSVMAEESHPDANTPRRVFGSCGFAATSIVTLLAIAGGLVLPWTLRWVYGAAFAPATLVAVLGLAVAVVHMGNAPAAARLTIVNIRMTSAVNTVWALFVGAAATWLFFRGCTAVAAMSVLLAGHILSAGLVLFILARRDELPAGMARLFSLSTGAAIVMVLVARAAQNGVLSRATASLGLVILFIAAASLFRRLPQRHCWVPPVAQVRETLTRWMRGLKRARAQQHGEVGR